MKIKINYIKNKRFWHHFLIRISQDHVKITENENHPVYFLTDSRQSCWEEYDLVKRQFTREKYVNYD